MLGRMKRLIFLSATLCFAAVLTTDNAQPIKAAVRSTPGDATLAD